MDETLQNLNEKIKLLEFKIDSLLDDVVEDKMFKSARAEEKLVAFLLSLQYLKDKRAKLKESLESKISRVTERKVK